MNGRGRNRWVIIASSHARSHATVENSRRFLLVPSPDGDTHRKIFSPISCVFIPLSKMVFEVLRWDLLPWPQGDSHRFGCLFWGSHGGFTSQCAMSHCTCCPVSRPKSPFHWNGASSAARFTPEVGRSHSLRISLSIHFHHPKENLLLVAESSFQQNRFSKKKKWVVHPHLHPIFTPQKETAPK